MCKNNQNVNNKFQTSENFSSVFRQLSPEETNRLERQGCRCRQWSDVTVEDPFDISCYFNVVFSGKVILGSVGDSTVEVVAGIPRRRGIYDAVIADCRIGREVYINNVKGGLANLDIEDKTVIDSTYSISCHGKTCHGNDVKLKVMSETGGREVTINTAMSAPLAYLTIFYRHDALLSKALAGMAERFANEKMTERGHIGKGAVIVDCGEIVNVDACDGAVIRGAARLKNGTVGRAFVGAGVIAEDFIIQDGATIDSAALLKGCLAGHCVEITSGFTAHDTMAFTNSRLTDGESAAAFCGPFTTSMHKSSLLIGGLFSFFNAGSGTNQSNHHYKLGPKHFGILSRGCKTGSDSYILWPSVIGAFTTVIGHHYSYPDTRIFPFSYLLDNPDGGKLPLLLPGALAGSAGLARDINKWPAKMGKEAENDPVNFNWLSPYTVGNLLKGLSLLEEINDGAGYDGAVIPREAVTNGITRYKLLIRLFIADLFRCKILAIVATNPEITSGGLLDKLRREPPKTGAGHWVDLCGMLAPRDEVDRLTREIISNPEITVGEANRLIDEINSRYRTYCWNWTWHNLGESARVDFRNMTAGDLSRILSEGAEATAELEALFVKDAAKEHDPERASLGFGIDAGDNRQEILDDFDRVRGSIAAQQFPAQIHRRAETFRGSIKNILTLLNASSEPSETVF